MDFSIRNFGSIPLSKDYQALKCPFCSNIFVESLWSLLSHLQISHEEEQNTFKSSIENLEKLKINVPRRCVSIIRPAFMESGEPTDFLAMLLLHSQNSKFFQTAIINEASSSYSTEVFELSNFNTNNDLDNSHKTCNICGELLPANEFINHFDEHRKQEELFIQTNSTNLKNIFIDSLNIDQASQLSHLNAKINEELNKKLFFNNTPVPPDTNQPLSVSISPKINTSTSRIGSVIVAKDADILSSSSTENTSIKTIPEINLSSTANVTQNLEKSKITVAPTSSNIQLTKSIKNQSSPNQSIRRLSASKNVSLICNQCGKLFENRCKLTRHLIDHKMAQSPYRCPFSNCLQCYDSRLKFRSHLVRVHKQLSDEEVSTLLDEGDREVVRLKGSENSTVEILTQSNINEQIDSNKSTPKPIFNITSDHNLLINPLENFELLSASSSYPLSQTHAIGIHKNLNNIVSSSNNEVKKDNLKRKLGSSTNESIMIPKIELEVDIHDFSSSLDTIQKKVSMET